MEFEIKSRFDDLYNHNDWSKDEHKFLKPYACKPDVMYGLCKVYEGTTGNDNVPPSVQFCLQLILVVTTL